MSVANGSVCVPLGLPSLGFSARLASVYWLEIIILKSRELGRSFKSTDFSAGVCKGSLLSVWVKKDSIEGNYAKQDIYYYNMVVSLMTYPV